MRRASASWTFLLERSCLTSGHCHRGGGRDQGASCPDDRSGRVRSGEVLGQGRTRAESLLCGDLPIRSLISNGEALSDVCRSFHFIHHGYRIVFERD
jgi:hypothetical protein